MPVVVQHLRNVQVIAGQRCHLIDPGAVLAVVDLGEDALHGKGAAPGADVPWPAARGAAGLPRLIDAAGGVENDPASDPIDYGGLLKGDDVGPAGAAREQLGEVVFGGPVVVVDIGDVVAAGKIEQALALGPYGAGAVVGKSQHLDARIAAEAVEQDAKLIEPGRDGGDEDGEERIHG